MKRFALLLLVLATGCAEKPPKAVFAQAKPKQATIAISPTSASVPVGGSQQFLATTTGTTKLPTWTATGGAITSSGRFTAGQVPGAYAVTAQIPGNIRIIAPVTVTPVTDTAPPTVPTNLTVTNKTQTSFDLGWNPSTDAVGVSGYGIYVGTLVDVATGAGTSFSGLLCGSTRLVEVDAFDAAGNRSPKASISVTTLACTPIPTVLVFGAPLDYATNVTSCSVELRPGGAATTSPPIATRNLGKPAAAVNNDITVDISTLVDPLPSGTYYAIVVSIGPYGSTPSLPSASFLK